MRSSQPFAAAAEIADRLTDPAHGRTWHRYDYAVWGRFGEAGSTVPAHRVRRFGAAPWQSRKRAAMACYRSQLTRLIDDDPDGFVMPPALVEHFASHDEIFVEGEERLGS